MTETNNEIFSNPDKFHEHIKQINHAPQKEEVSASKPSEDIAKEENEEIVEEIKEVEETEDTPASSDDDESYKEKKFIPKSRFNQEIEKRRSLEEQLTKEREDKIRFETQLKMLQEMQAAQAESVTAAPLENQYVEEFEPLDSDSHKIYMKKINELEKKLETIGTETTQKTQQLQYQNYAAAQQQAFEKVNPDFETALQYLKNVETQVASEFYDENQAKQVVAQKLQGAIVSAINSGKNAAEVMYKMAKTYGYKPENTIKPTPSSNLDAINNNMKKGASIQSLGNSVGIGDNNKLYDIKHMLRDPKNPSSGIDPDKFQKALSRAR